MREGRVRGGREGEAEKAGQTPRPTGATMDDENRAPPQAGAGDVEEPLGSDRPTRLCSRREVWLLSGDQ
jgi:hypothetical protein